MSAPLDPLKLPAPPGFGYTGRNSLKAPGNFSFAYGMGELPDFGPPTDPAGLTAEFESLPRPQVPDYLRVNHGKADKQVVGDMLRVMQGEDPQQYSFLTPEIAEHYLTQWGYPLRMNDWTEEEWQSAFDGAALEFNPLSIFEIGYQ